MADSREFKIEGSLVTLCFWLGLIVLAMAGFLLAGPLIDPGFPWWLAGVSGGLALGGGWWCLRLALRPAIYSIELSDEGVRIPAEGKWAPWSSLSSLSECPFAQRIDILDLKGARFASLDYNLESFSEAVERAVVALEWTAPGRDTFRRSFSDLATILAILVGAGMAGFGAWSWLQLGERAGALLATLLLGAAVYDLITEIWSVTLGTHDFSVRHGLRTKTVSWEQVEGVRLVLRRIGNGNRLLDVVVSQVGGPALRVRPLGANPLDVFSSFRKRLSARPHASPMRTDRAS